MAQRKKISKEQFEERHEQSEAVVYGRRHAREFVQDNYAAIVRLISTYGDGDAVKKLENLREVFWAREWNPKEKR